MCFLARKVSRSHGDRHAVRRPTRTVMNLAKIPAQSLNIACQCLYRLLDSGENKIRYCKKNGLQFASHNLEILSAYV